MSCCGQKRKAFREELNDSSRFEAENPSDFEPETAMPPKVFTYTGEANMTIRGISSGTVYRFRYNGEKVEVDYYDSFAMMAERDLKIVK